MAEGFGENVAPTAAIRAILGSYPFSVGLLREILQNSDDARALKQIFVLDKRQHRSDKIYDPYLACTQGPALLASNNAIITPDDWKALQNIHRSSKVTDTSKIGKYGIGFRSCYHITDTPHILSGSYLGILDPKHDFAEIHGMMIGGIKFNIEEEWQKYSDHLTSFDACFPRNDWGKHFNGTVFRLPLRTQPSDISNKVVDVDEITNLFRDFIREELDICLLFLRNITSIEIYEIDVDGTRSLVASAKIDRTPLQQYSSFQIRHVFVTKSLGDGHSEERGWRILHAPLSEQEAIEKLSLRLGGNPVVTLSQHKLIPTIDLAVPLHISTESQNQGRLFTFLPLPLRTEFPVHINGLFSLTHSRQNLRNGGEVGIVKNSDDHALVEWNRILFDTYIPQAWANLLGVLVEEDNVADIFDAWPIAQADVASGDYVYWKDMPLHVMQHAIRLRVWPIFGTQPVAFATATSIVVAKESEDENLLRALACSGMSITHPPNYLTDIFLENFSEVTILSPQSVHTGLQNACDKLIMLDDNRINIIMSYLLSTNNCRYLMGLPIIPTTGQGRISLDMSSSGKHHVLFDASEERLFYLYEPIAISLKQLPSNAQLLLIEQGCQILNITTLQPSHVVCYLKSSDYASKIHKPASDTQMEWLNGFWTWVSTWHLGSNLVPKLDHFSLVPITQGFRTLTTSIFDTEGDKVLTSTLEKLAIPVIDSRLNSTARSALKCLKSTADIHSLLSVVPTATSVSDFDDEAARYLLSFLIRNLPIAYIQKGSLDNHLRARLRSLPIFPTVSFSASARLSTQRVPISATSNVRGVDPDSISVLPNVPSTVFLDLRHVDQSILQYLEPQHRNPLTPNDIQQLTLQHFDTQTFDIQLAFISYLDVHRSSISQGILTQLAAKKFVPARNGSLQMPKDLVDPETPLAQLYPGSTVALPETSRVANTRLVQCLRNLNLLKGHLSLEIVRERIVYISHNPNSENQRLARSLINLIYQSHLDCQQLFNPLQISWELAWIPTPAGLRSPLRCRDAFSHSSKIYLFDEVLPLVEHGVRIGNNLRAALNWNGDVPFETISQQLKSIIHGKTPSFDKIREIIKELGGRDVTQDQIETLERIVHGHAWIPSSNGHLVEASHALLSTDGIPALGFHPTSFNHILNPCVIIFLRRMGCTDRPSKDLILKTLNQFHRSSASSRNNTSTIKALVRLLSWLPSLTLEDKKAVYIPDINCTLQPFEKIVYNDIGNRVHLIDIGDRTLAHSYIDDGLARQLGIARLGLLPEIITPEFDIDFDMGEDLMTTIRNRLRDYTDSQLLLEFFANAQDAGASQFKILIDHQVGPTTNLLTSQCAAFQQCPALVIYNNGIFTNSDYKGILRTGIGGKSGRSDSIGQFGLGALTMFHITEFAMIISGDHVLFLNPCKAHLPIDRASLLLSLSRVRKLFADHLAPLVGLFGFHLPKDVDQPYTYNGTIFRLPVRSPPQFHPHLQPIFKRTAANLSNIVEQFQSIASKCLLFTDIVEIALFHRESTQLQMKWSLSADREEHPSIGNFISVHTVKISGPGISRGETWRVFNAVIQNDRWDPSLLRLREQYRLRIPPTIRIATSNAALRNHNLFSILPLPITLDLPVHLSAPFILAPDRRSIRLDEYETSEALYNRWLLAKLIPDVYMRVLQDSASRSRSDHITLWPGYTIKKPVDHFDHLSKTITDALCYLAAETDLQIFPSKYASLFLPSKSAWLLYDLPEAISETLKILQPCDLVHLSPSIVCRMLRNENRKLSTVNPKYIKQVLLKHSDKDLQRLRFETLQQVINYLLADDVENLHDIPLLPLEDGEYTKFGNPSEVWQSRYYVAPLKVLQLGVFNPSRLVHRKLNTEIMLKSEKLNIEAVSDANITYLINEFITPSPLMENVAPDLCDWINKFWKACFYLQIQPSTIAMYPVVPTLRQGCYVAIEGCSSAFVLISDFKYKEWLSKCLIEMGFLPVDHGILAPEIRSIVKCSWTTSEDLIDILCHSSRKLEDLFDSLSTESHQRFVDWIKNSISFHKRKFIQRHPEWKHLPIWETANQTYRAATDVLMLPQNIRLRDIAPFAFGNVANHDTLLANLGAGSIYCIKDILNLPTSLDSTKRDAYETLIDALLTQKSISSIPVPDSYSRIVESNSLYARDRLFLMAFENEPYQFMLLQYRHLEQRLTSYGLKRQSNLDIDMFKECAKAVQKSAAENLRERAAVVFHAFSVDLPLRVSSLQKERWTELKNIRFIPKKLSPRPLDGIIDTNGYIAPYIKLLPDVVSPTELVRKEFSAIAWSQRAIYDVEPDQRVCLAYPELSVPTTEEVINHLVVLATRVARHYPRRLAVLDHIKQTYEWLENHSTEAEVYLSRLTQEKLFLNVDDPISEDWHWDQADHILLETYDTGFCRCAREFLVPFKKLLLAAGAHNVIYADLPLLDSASKDRPTAICMQFNEMRKEGVCTDVIFTFNKGEPLKAHRIFLAACSTHFKDSFTGSFKEAADASTDNPIKIPVGPYSRRCVESVLGYAYTGQMPPLSRIDVDVDVALEMLELSHSWMMLDAHETVQNIIIRAKMIDPFNLDQIQTTAEDTRASLVLERCERFKNDNARLVQRARMESTSPAQN